MTMQWTFHTFEKNLGFCMFFFFVDFTLLSSKSVSSSVDGSYIDTYNLMHSYI
jgi:hypothetical protein